MEKHFTIWSGNINEDDWDCTNSDLGIADDADEYDRSNAIRELNNDYFYDEFRYNLNKEVDGEIIALASLDLWDGCRSAYETIGSNLRNLPDAACDLTFATFYGDGKDILATVPHHDGTDFITYRLIPSELADEFWDHAENGVTKETIDKYTVSLFPNVAKIYGWAV